MPKEKSSGVTGEKYTIYSSDMKHQFNKIFSPLIK